MTTDTIDVPIQSSTKGLASDDRIYVDDPDAKKFYQHQADAMTLDTGDLVPNDGELWIVRIVNRKAKRGARDGIHWEITMQSPRGTSFSFDPRREEIGRINPVSLRNLRFYRPRRGF